MHSQFISARHLFWIQTTKGADEHMFNRYATLAAICLSLPLATAPVTAADPDADPGPPPPDGAVASAAPGVATTPDGWTLTVSGTNETEVAVPPLTTALSSRDYVVGGTFTGSVTGKGSSKPTGGTLEAGYQIGCGISLDRVELQFGAAISPSFTAAGLASVSAPLTFAVEIELFPGQVTAVAVDKKTFKTTDTRITIGSFHIKIDGCVGQSFLRSYATLISSTDTNDTVVSYLGVTKVV
jgi:hypothetical protein